MKFLKLPCGCVKLVDSQYDITNPEKVKFPNAIKVFGCQTARFCFEESKNNRTATPEQIDTFPFEWIELDSDEGRLVMAVLNAPFSLVGNLISLHTQSISKPPTPTPTAKTLSELESVLMTELSEFFGVNN